MFPAKEAPASSHMLVSRAEPMIAELLKSKEPQGFFKTACVLRRNLLPVIICLSHGLRQGSSFLFEVSCKTACFLQRKLLPVVISRAKPMIAELLKSKELQVFFKTACLLRRNLLPVVIFLSHGLSQSLLVVPAFSCKTACFLRRNLLPVVIRLSHRLSQGLRGQTQ